MNSSLKAEIDSCVAELNRISRELNEVSSEVQRSIHGMSTAPYTRTLENCAGKYRSAANQLNRIK